MSAAVVVVLTLAGTASTVASASAPQQSKKPKAADVGITSKEIRVAVVADVDTTLSPGLFQASVDAMNAWAKIVNRQGGLAGRKVVVDFIDSKLSPDESRNAVIKACAEDFAMVGSEALFLNNVDDMIACPNAEGDPVGLPDMPGLALDFAQRCSPVTYTVTGDPSVCATKDDHPQTWTATRGDFRYYLSQEKNLHGIFGVPSDLKSARDSILPSFQAGVDLGIKKDGSGYIDVSARAQQSSMTPLVQELKDNDSNFFYNGSSAGIMVLVRREARIQGADSVKVWGCNSGCYDINLIKEGGADVEGTTSMTTTLPFYSDYKAIPTLKLLVKELGGVDELNSNAVNAFTAALLFQDVVEKVVASGAALSRQSLLDALEAEHEFDAQGIIGPTDVGRREPPHCFVISEVKNGKWTRLHPKKTATFDCRRNNSVKIELDLLG